MRFPIILFILLYCNNLFAGGLQASFTGSSFPCGDDPELVFCYDGTVDPSGNLVDKSGENLITDRTEFDDWTQAGTCAVTADQWRSPVNGEMVADYLDNTGGTSAHLRYFTTADLGSLTGRTFTGSVWIRADYDHVCSLYLYETGVGYIDGPKDVSVTKTWKRFFTSGTAVGGGANTISIGVVPAEYGIVTGKAYFSDAHLVENDQWRTNLGNYLNPSDQTITKPAHDLTDSPTPPTRALADVEWLGNRLKARLFNGSNNAYSVAHHASMNVNDTDHTYTFYVMRDSGAAGLDMIFSHGSNNVDGVRIWATGTEWNIQYNAFGSHTDVINTDTTNDGYYHVIQIVRDSNTATVYVDGVAGTGVDVTGFGLDGSQTLYIGRDGSGSFWDGTVAFAKLEAFARTEDELASDREKIWATYGGKGSSFANWTFSRSTVAMKTFTAGAAHAINSKMAQVAANVPRVTDGLLVEGQSTNYCLRSDDFDNWSKQRVSVTANSTIALDGSITVDTIHEDATAANTHAVYRGSMSVTNGDSYTVSVFAIPINRTWVSMKIGDAGTLPQAYFDISNGLVGTETNCTAKIEAIGPFYRCSMTWTASATSNARYFYIRVAEADNDDVFDGLDQDSLYLWGAQYEDGTFATSYIATTTEPITRTADDVTMLPVRFTGLPLDGSETMWIDFSQDPMGATITTSDGGYTLTKSGQPEHHRTEVFGDYHWFDGTNDYYSRVSDGTFNPAGDFSVQCIVIPSSVDGTIDRIIGKWTAAGNQYGWILYRFSTILYFDISDDGTTGGGHYTSITKDTLVADKPFFITATYNYITDGTSEMNLYVNDLSTSTSVVANGPVHPSTGSFIIGNDGAASGPWGGDLLYCDFSNDVVLTEAQHDAAYAMFVQDYVLPKHFGDGSTADKLTVRVDLKCQYSGSSNIGQTRDLFEIGGNYGTATWTRNRVLLEATQAGRLYFWLSDDADADHYALTAPDPLNFDEWFGLWFFVDFNDLSRMDGWYRQGLTGDWTRVTSWNGNSGSAELNLNDTMIQIGADPSGTVEANCEFQNLDIRAEEIRP